MTQSTKQHLERHSHSFIYPDMKHSMPDQFRDLVASIQRGYDEQFPITVDKASGKIVDGWNRYQACLVAGVDPSPHLKRVKFDSEEDLVEFVIRANHNRRHLSKVQRAVGLAKAESKTQSKRAAREIAKLHGMSEAMVSQARVIVDGGTDEEIDDVLSGKVPARAVLDRVRQERREYKPARKMKMGQFSAPGNVYSDFERQRIRHKKTMSDAMIDAVRCWNRLAESMPSGMTANGYLSSLMGNGSSGK